MKRALTRPGQTWHLVLSFVPTASEIEDCARISQDLPWLPKLGAGVETLFRDLRQRGLAVVACGDESEALGLQGLVRGSRLSAQVCKGRRAQGRGCAGERCREAPAQVGGRRPRRVVIRPRRPVVVPRQRRHPTW